MRTSQITRRIGLALATLACCLGLAACVTVEPGAGTGTGTAASSGESLEDRVSSGLTIQAERGSETLEITRAKPGASKPAKLDKNSWTVFVYLCGSDLETQNGSATKDLSEMVGASGSSNISFVVQTGGAKTWRNNAVKTRQLGRFLIQDGSISEVGSTTAASMGDPNTLANFLAWGIQNYPAEHMAVIMWDHGGGSINGVCFDERNNYDSLSLREMDAAFAAVYQKLMWDKFEFVGFDACLMSTLEAANVLASYSKYMIASQESEPANGWEYSSIIEYLAKNPATDGKALGKTICDTYLASLDRNSKGFATLSVVDLSQVDDLIQDFYRFSQEMYASGEDQKTLAAMSRGIQKADNYGGNNWREGYSNMVDLGGIVDACSSVTPSASDVKASLHKAVTYQIRGTYHAAASGLSTYYPLKIQNSKELSIFQSIAVNPSYLSYVDRLAHGATYNGGAQYQQYSNDPIFGEGGLWSWLTGTAEQVQQQEQTTDEHWNYVDDHSDNAASTSQITFAVKPYVDNEGTYRFQLDQNGIDNASVVSGLVYETSADGKDLIALGETYDIMGDWSTGEFYDAFDGYWLSLPDGQSLCLKVLDKNSDYVIFTAPIILNGKECFLRLRQSLTDNKVSVEGAWSGVSTNGMIDRNIVGIKRGDKITPLYNAFTPEQGVAENSYEGEEYTVTSKRLTVSYSGLPNAKYLYGFCIEDVFGDYFLTDTVTFEIDENGDIYF